MSVGSYLPSIAAWQDWDTSLDRPALQRPSLPDLCCQVLAHENAEVVAEDRMQQYVIDALGAGANDILLACKLVSTGSLTALKELSIHRPHQGWTLWAAQLASAQGKLDLLEWMLSLPPPVVISPVDCAVAAAQHLQLQVLSWLLDNRLRFLYGGIVEHEWPGLAWVKACDLPEEKALFVCKLLHALDWPGIPFSERCFAAAGEGHMSVLKWLQSIDPGCIHEVGACCGAADEGNLSALQWLRSQGWAWDAEVCCKAAQNGHLDTLRWLRSQDPPCPLDDDETLFYEKPYCLAAQHGHFQVVEWLLTAEPCSSSAHHLAIWAARQPHTDTLRFLQASGRLRSLPLDRSLLDAAGEGTLEIAKLLTPYLLAHSHEEAMLWALVAAIECVPEMSITPPARLDVIKWLYGHFATFNTYQRAVVLRAAADAHSPVLLELAACSHGPALPWNAEAHSLAAALGDLALLRWLLQQQKSRSMQQVHELCPAGRMLLLVHGHGWSMPKRMALGRFREAQLRHQAFYDAARQLRLRQGSCSLGSLPEVLLKRIACAADIHFSWSLSS